MKEKQIGKSPAFQFYPAEWLGSVKVNVMTLEEQAAYLRLLCHAWLTDDCGLPDDDLQLSRLSGLGEGWLNGGSGLVRSCFEKVSGKSGRIYNLRLLKEREKQREWREKSRLGGKESGRIRSYKAKGGSTKDEPNPNQSATLQSSAFPSSVLETVPTIAPSAKGELAQEPETQRAVKPEKPNPVWIGKPPIQINRETFEWRGIAESDLAAWSKTYPACDIKVELGRMAQWCRAEWSSGKGRKSDYLRFIVKWLDRQQNQGGSRNGRTDPEAFDFEAWKAE